MEFTSKLRSGPSIQEIKFPEIFERFDNGAFVPRHTEPLYIEEELYLSIQGSGFHHCWPKTVVDYHLYTSMEVAVVANGQLCKIDAITDSKLLYREFNKYYSGPVYSNVPVHLIERLYQNVKKNRGFYEWREM